MAFQTSYNYSPAAARPGMMADLGEVVDKISRVLDGALFDFGVGVIRGDKAGRCKAPEGAIVDKVIATGATSTSVQHITTGPGMGVKLDVPSKLTFISSSSADFDATTGHFIGIGEDGEAIDETFAIPNNGNTTVTSTHYFREPTEVTIPAQSGTGGTFTVGVAADYSGALDEEFLGVVMFDASKPPKGSTNASTLDDGDNLTVIRKGRVWVHIDGDVTEGDGAVYVRVLSGAAGSVLGAFRADSDTSTALLVKGCRWASTQVKADGIAMLELNLPGTG